MASSLLTTVHAALTLAALTAGCAQRVSGTGVATLRYAEQGEAPSSSDVPVLVTTSCFDSCNYTIARLDDQPGVCPAFDGMANADPGALPLSAPSSECVPKGTQRAHVAWFESGQVKRASSLSFHLVYPLAVGAGSP